MSKIIKTEVQLTGELRPRQHYALVFPDAYSPEDLIPYRNALTQAVKTITVSEEACQYIHDELFWLIQLAEFITTALDDNRKSKGNAQL